MARQTKTPKQRAEEALGVAERRHKRLTDQAKTARQDLRRLEAELEEATRLREYAKQHPTLQTPGTTPTQEEGTQA